MQILEEYLKLNLGEFLPSSLVDELKVEFVKCSFMRVSWIMRILQSTWQTFYRDVRRDLKWSI